jgi:hypothetical protein
MVTGEPAVGEGHPRLWEAQPQADPHPGAVLLHLSSQNANNLRSLTAGLCAGG